MKIEDMNFEPRRGFAIFAIALSVIFTLVFGTVAVVNFYRQLREPTSTLDVFGWLGTLVVALSCSALLLYVSTAIYRIAFHEAGVVILGLRGRRFVPWSAVRDARVNRFKGNVELALRADGRRLPVSIPLNSYKKSLTLMAELRRRLPVPVHDPAEVAATLTDV
jgi:Bacterial PH domain